MGADHTFGSRLKAARESHNMSMQDLSSALAAAGVDVSQQTVSKWERDIARPRKDKLAAIAEALELPEATVRRWWAGIAADPDVPDVPEWAKTAGNLSAETVAAIRLLIQADQERHRE